MWKRATTSSPHVVVLVQNQRQVLLRSRAVRDCVGAVTLCFDFILRISRAFSSMIRWRPVCCSERYLHHFDP